MVNATLTQIIAPGGLDAYGDATTGTVAWAGRQACYLRRPRKSRSTDREADSRIDEAILQAPGTAALQALLAYGDHAEASRITVEDSRNPAAPVTRTYELAGLDVRAIGSPADSVRLTLRREA